MIPETATGPPPVPLAAAAVALQRLLAERCAAGPPPAVVPLGTTDVLEPERDGVAGRARATVHLTPEAVLIGPWTADGGPPPACGRCLAMRRQRLRPRHEREGLEFGGPLQATGAWPPLTRYLTDAVWYAHQQTLAAADRRGPRPSAALVTRIDLETLRTRTHPLLADPLCPACGDHRSPDDAPGRLTLRSRPKPSPTVFRQLRPAQYRLPVQALANPVCGALGTGTARNLASPTTAPVAGGTLMRGHTTLTEMAWSGQANSYALSRDLALLEGLERYAGTRRRNRRPVLTAPYADVARDALDPRECGLYSPAAHAHYDRLRPFDPHRPIPWVWGHSLRDDRPLLVPVRLAYYATGTDADNFVFECSNGCASGGSLEEATLFGLLELIERDAFLLAWYGGVTLPRIDLDTVDDAELRGMTDRAALCGYDVRVFDNRMDISTPVATAVAVRRDGGDGSLAFAAGASPDPATAIRAAVGEALSFVPALPATVADRRTELLAMARDFDRVRHLRDHAALFALPRMRRHAAHYLGPAAPVPYAVLYAGLPGPSATDLLEDLHRCRDELVRAGFDVIVVDQTCPEQRPLGLHTVCTLVPGLLPIDFGWPQQRAPHMPRMLSALRRTGLHRTESDLHRVPHPFP
ncbi:hypothetical protein AF335_09145 [Streptomyces eurocidicus]|uniref:Ribosomal protein S12 methylthiotransferase accessory factor n=1 Tax=Streptomyces eurocidicus TaxID=66423 RepID=A0A2N8P0Y8_STREU|nr:TOMM precursor leader peptide-binding protein [Streptomyces eurocidicus]MBB5121808.1 ribosomal protein S12 methylthiotransferase accessory factor [Streptomyces eurocidicus]MBF6055074.1 TOMM precursor leader peptide-binding protein [Streptomyces eurocidicus]PNE34678.1 hypothetical protein AF335_09145 [Streptomyces eurocidicus]